MKGARAIAKEAAASAAVCGNGDIDEEYEAFLRAQTAGMTKEEEGKIDLHCEVRRRD